MRSLSLTVLAFLALLSANAGGCTIPVFRFALDRWEPDNFELALSENLARDPTVMDLLRPIRAGGHANLQIRTVREAAGAELFFPSPRGAPPVWSGDGLDAAALSRLLDSPGRRAILERLLAGHSVVWVLADGGSAEDDAQAQRLEKRLAFLEQVAALPIQNPHDPDSQLGPGPPLMLEFSLLRIRRDDPAEAPLVQMLAGPGRGEGSASATFAAAVFGRGRVLGAWPVADLDDRVLEDACLFLVGRCSCRVKNESPGWDLLMDVNWESALAKVAAASAAGPGIEADAASDVTSDPVAADAAPVAVVKTAESFSTPEKVEVTASPAGTVTAGAGRPWAWWLGGGALALVGAALLLARGGKRS